MKAITARTNNKISFDAAMHGKILNSPKNETPEEISPEQEAAFARAMSDAQNRVMEDQYHGE